MCFTKPPSGGFVLCEYLQFAQKYWGIITVSKTMKKGFTLIELLVVIAIIGLLAAVALASLRDARFKAADSKIVSSLASLKTQANLLVARINSFGAEWSGECTSDQLSIEDEALVTANPDSIGIMFAAAPGQTSTDEDIKIEQILVSTALTSSSAGYCYASDPNSVGQTWVVAFPLKSNPDILRCVDSSGFADNLPEGATLSLPLDQSPFLCSDYTAAP